MNENTRITMKNILKICFFRYSYHKICKDGAMLNAQENKILKDIESKYYMIPMLNAIRRYRI